MPVGVVECARLKSRVASKYLTGNDYRLKQRWCKEKTRVAEGSSLMKVSCSHTSIFALDILAAPMPSLKRQLARKTRKFRQRYMPPKEVVIRLKAGTHAWSMMKPVYDRTSRIAPGEHLLMTMGRDENLRIPHFLDHYRSLGIDHFLFVDNLSRAPMADMLAAEDDCSLWWTNQPYENARWGVDWMNALLPRFAKGHWCLTVDLDEYFVFPHIESRSLRELTHHLDDIGKPSLYSLLIDMYPEGPIDDALLHPGQDPLEIAPLFDGSGYHAQKSNNGTILVRGGPRLRSINDGALEGAPAINKIPLVKWNHGYSYNLSTHELYPTNLNHAHHQGIHTPTGALLHFKFLSTFREKVSQAIEEGNHYNNSSEYQQYQKHIDAVECFRLDSEVSTSYTGSASLLDHNLITSGHWA